MNVRRYALAFVVLLLALLAALLPMRLVLPDGMISVRKVEGSIWSARLNDARIGPLSLGDIDAGLRWPGWLAFHETSDRPGGIEGRLRPVGGGVELRDASGALALSGEARAMGGERLDLSAVSLDWGDAGCHHASGRVRLQLVPEVAGVQLGQLLTGTPKCQDGRFTLRLASQAGLESLEIELRPGGGYRSVMSIRPTDPAASAKLIAAGFRETPTGYQLEQSGAI